MYYCSVINLYQASKSLSLNFSVCSIRYLQLCKSCPLLYLLSCIIIYALSVSVALLQNESVCHCFIYCCLYVNGSMRGFHNSLGLIVLSWSSFLYNMTVPLVVIGHYKHLSYLKRLNLWWCYNFNILGFFQLRLHIKDVPYLNCLACQSY